MHIKLLIAALTLLSSFAFAQTSVIKVSETGSTELKVDSAYYRYKVITAGLEMYSHKDLVGTVDCIRNIALNVDGKIYYFDSKDSCDQLESTLFKLAPAGELTIALKFSNSMIVGADILSHGPVENVLIGDSVKRTTLSSNGDAIAWVVCLLKPVSGYTSFVFDPAGHTLLNPVRNQIYFFKNYADCVATRKTMTQLGTSGSRFSISLNRLTGQVDGSQLLP